MFIGFSLIYRQALFTCHHAFSHLEPSNMLKKQTFIWSGAFANFRLTERISHFSHSGRRHCSNFKLYILNCWILECSKSSRFRLLVDRLVAEQFCIDIFTLRCNLGVERQRITLHIYAFICYYLQFKVAPDEIDHEHTKIKQPNLMLLNKSLLI